MEVKLLYHAALELMGSQVWIDLKICIDLGKYYLKVQYSSSSLPYSIEFPFVEKKDCFIFLKTIYMCEGHRSYEETPGVGEIFIASTCVLQSALLASWGLVYGVIDQAMCIYPNCISYEEGRGHINRILVKWSV